MDETLIHSIFNDVGNSYRQDEARKRAGATADSFDLVMEDGDRAVVNMRPGLRKFMEEINKHFEPIVFTAGLRCYAEPLLNTLDPEGKNRRLPVRS